MFCIFVAWLLYRKLDVLEDECDEETLQTQLAQAWNFGAEFDIPALQNDVMAKLLKLFAEQRISPKATVEAYRPKERGSLLQKAFVQYLASDMKEDLAWRKEDFTSCVLGEDPTFLLDLTLALSEDTDAAETDREFYMLETDGEE